MAISFAQRGFRVLFINPLVSPGFACRKKNISSNLSVLTLRIPFRASNCCLIQSIACRLSAMLLRKWLPQPWQEMWCWIAEPSFFKFIHLPWGKVLYDRCDQHGMFPGQRLQTWQFYENQIYQKAHLIFTSSEVLAIAPKATGHSEVHLLANAGRDSFNQKNRSRQAGGPPSLNRTKRLPGSVSGGPLSCGNPH